MGKHDTGIDDDDISIQHKEHDDNHISIDDLNDIITCLNNKFGKESPLSMTYGKVLKYLDMTLDNTTTGKVKICMYKYIDKMLAELLTTETPAARHLFNVNLEARKLPEATAQIFLHLAAKLLYLLRCARQDIQTAIAFLCTRVQAPNEDDYKKLMRVNAVPMF